MRNKSFEEVRENQYADRKNIANHFGDNHSGAKIRLGLVLDKALGKV